MSAYFTHDNGGRPFLVGISNEEKTISVYKQNPTETDSENDDFINEPSNGHYDELVLTIDDFEKVFIGLDEASNTTGHSILVKISPTKYIYIGSVIYEFKTTDEIFVYKAPIGNSDVVYDYAIGGKNIYLLAEKAFFNKKYFDPYTIYYGHKPDSKKMRTKIIHKRLY